MASRSTPQGAVRPVLRRAALGVLVAALVALPFARPGTAAAAGPTPAPTPTATSSAGASSPAPTHVASPAPTNHAPTNHTPAATADAAGPSATDDTAFTPFHTSVRLAGVTNDQPGDPTVPLQPARASFPSADLSQAPAGSTLSTDRRTLTAKGQGTWKFDPDGSVWFSPATGYAGTPRPVTYVVGDADGRTADATLSVTVRPGPVGVPDTATTPQNKPVTLNVLTNDRPGYSADGDRGAIFNSGTHFAATGQPPGSTFDGSDQTSLLTVPGQGQYLARSYDGTVTFTPDPTFVGTASPVVYVGSDWVHTATSADVHNAYSSTLTVTVSRTQPVAVDDTATTAFDSPVQVAVLQNDSAGIPTTPLAPRSVSLRLTAGLPAASTLLEQGKLLRVPGTGDFSVGIDGAVTFFPAQGFVGAAPPVTYSVADANGTTVTATLRVTVAGPLTVTTTAGSSTIDRTGQTVAYTVAVHDTGDLDVADLLVESPGAGLSPLVCAPVAQGGTLAAGATTTCRATRTTALADLRQPSLTDTVSVSGRLPGGQAATGAASVTVAVAVAPPKATDQHTWAVAHGRTVVFPAALTATPAVPGGPPIDVSRTYFPDAPYHHGKIAFGVGIWTVLPDGSIQLDPFYDGPGQETIRYEVFDVLGHSTTATLTLTLRASATWDDIDVSTLQGQPVTFDPLRADTPGQQLDGSPATFDRRSVRLYRDTGSFGVGTISPDGKVETIPWVGTYTVGTDGRVTFDPAPQLSTSSSWILLQYTAEDTAGSQVAGYVRVHVVALRPKTQAETRATTYGHPVTFAAASDDLPGNPAAPIVETATVLTAPLVAYGQNPGSLTESATFVDRAGTWQVQPDGSVRFTPAPGYAGTDVIAYAAVDTNGTRGRASLTVTVRPGPLARADRASTPRGRPLTLDPLANDVPGRLVDGSPGTFDRASLRFATAGQPAGSTVSPSRARLTVPGQGVWTIGAGSLVLTPTVGFAGGAAAVSYSVTDSSGNVATGAVTATVTSDLPAANDDLASTPYDTPVVVDASADDSAGDVPLDLASTVFPADGQPPGSTRSADGRTLVVPGQGRWALATDGTATFSPVAGFVGTSAATYAVSDRAGRVARASVRAQVRPGPQARPDTTVIAEQQHNSAALAVLQNDVPSRNADGTLGVTEKTTLRLAATGQPAGWTVAADGFSARATSGFLASVDQARALVEIDTVPGTTQGATGPLLYTVQDVATTAAGGTVRHTLTSSVQVVLPPYHPTAVDDHGETTSPAGVVLAGARNDVPAAPGASIDRASLRFPSAQLARLPKGTTIDDTGFSPTVVVPGEGTWTADVRPAEYDDGSEGTVRFDPVPGFVGETSVIDYSVSDSLGPSVQARLSVTVRPGYQARPDAVTTPQNVPVTLDILANDDPGQKPDGSRAAPASSVVVLDATGAVSGAGPGDSGLARYVPGEGTYRDGYVGGQVTFTPLPGFTGAATPVRFLIDNTWTSALQVTVERVTPVAHDDVASTTTGRPVVVPVLGNDAPGVPQVPLLGSSVRLRLVAGLPPGTTLSADARSLQVPGHGVFVAAGDGEITFVPLDGFTGAVPPVGYSVADVNDTTVRATVTVTVH